MSNVNTYKVTAENTLPESRFNITIDPLSYVIPILNTPRGAGNLGGTQIALDKPINNKTFSLSGKREGGQFEFTAFERFMPQNVDSVYNDRSYNPDTGTHTLDLLISELEAEGSSDAQDEADKLKARFRQDSSNNYVVRGVIEQRIWFKEYIHNPGLQAEWKLYGPGYDYRTVDGSNNPTGTPIFITDADIEPSNTTKGRGTGTLQFNVGGRL